MATAADSLAEAFMKQDPSWFVPQGRTIEASLGPDESLGPYVVLKNARVNAVIMWRGPDTFEVAWDITHANGKSGGTVTRMSTADIRQAFGLEDAQSDFQLRMAKKFDTLVSAAKEGRFFRVVDHLNIPHPGIGTPGDPNLSVFLTPDIRATMKDFVERSCAIPI